MAGEKNQKNTKGKKDKEKAPAQTNSEEQQTDLAQTNAPDDEDVVEVIEGDADRKINQELATTLLELRKFASPEYWTAEVNYR